MDDMNTNPGKVLTEERSKPPTFTFVPVLWALPSQSITTEETIPGALTGNSDQNFAVSHEETTKDTMSDGQIFKAEKVFIGDCEEGGAGNKIQLGTKPQTHKIKLSYKSLAAIPTNTLLLDQQTIDEQVERGESPYDTLDGGVADTHAEMRSPSQLRQQSEELYAVIDEILADSIPPSKTSQSPQPSRSTSTNTGQQNNSSFLKSLGRETKYASLSSLHQSTGVDRKLMDTKKTKPGVIRPMTAIPRLRVEDEEEFRPNPFRQYDLKQTTSDNRKAENKSLSKPGQDFYTRETTPERRTPFSVCDLQITEPDDRISHQRKDASTSFSTTEGRMNTFETHI
ncbi:muscular LMNA-interacting protein isoform 1-T1 [Tautogolabrus adspersus]